MLAPLADAEVVVHLVGRTRDLQVVRRHDRRNSAFPQQRQDRRRQMMIDAVRMGDVRVKPVQQPGELFPGIE
jgi:hypothetical protein